MHVREAAHLPPRIKPADDGAGGEGPHPHSVGQLGLGRALVNPPWLETRCSSTTFCMAFCIYLGLSNPSIEAAINTGLTTFLDKNLYFS